MVVELERVEYWARNHSETIRCLLKFGYLVVIHQIAKFSSPPIFVIWHIGIVKDIMRITKVLAI